MRDLLRRIRWLASGPDEEDPRAAFDWVTGPSGTAPNSEGLHSLLRTAAVLVAFAALVDLAILWHTDWRDGFVLAVAHVVWAGFFIAGAAHLSVSHLEAIDGRALRRLGGPNTLTLGRGLLVPPLVYLFATHDYRFGLIAYAVIVVSDMFDGLWARHGRLRSKFGIVLDPVADVFLHGSVFVTLGLVGLLPPLAVVFILARTAVLIFGAGVLHFRKGSVRIQPTPLGKGSGVLLALSTGLLLGLEAFAPGQWLQVVHLLRTLLTVLLGLLVLHAVAIGIINLGWRKPWLEQNGRIPPAGDGKAREKRP